MKKIHYLGFALTLFAILLSGCGTEEEVVGGSGLIEATDVIVSAETAGRIETLLFDEGTELQVGDTLVHIDTTRLALELVSAEAGRNVADAKLVTAKLNLQKAQEAEQYARSELDRVTRLLKTKTASQQQYDKLAHTHKETLIARDAAKAAIATIKAEIAKINADMNRIKRQLEDCYPTAPISGRVTEKYVETGELLAPGRPIAKIAKLDTVEVKVYLPAGDFAGVKTGDNAKVDTESGGEIYSGTVVWTSDEAEFTPKNVQTKKSRADLVYAVKVQIPNTDGKLKIGMPVFVTIGE